MAVSVNAEINDTTNLGPYWNMNDNTEINDDYNDFVDGTVSGATYNASGKINGMYDFDGTDDFADFGDNYFQTNFNAFTYGGWVYIDDVTDRDVIFGAYGSGGSASGIYIGVNNATGIYECSLGHDTDNKTVTATYTTGTWQHIICTWDGSELKFYIDGVYKANLTADETYNPNQDNATMGADSNSEGLYFNGKIDATGFWSDALTDGSCSINATCGGEVAELYNNGDGLEYPLHFPSLLIDSDLVETINTTQTNITVYYNITVTDTNEIGTCELLDGGSTLNTSAGTNMSETNKELFYSWGVINQNFSLSVYCANGEVANQTAQFLYNVNNCAEVWSPSYTACNILDNQTLFYTDNSSCGSVEDLPGDNATVSTCSYCVLSESQALDDCFSQLQTIYYVYDNFESCCNMTNISIDCDLSSNLSQACIGQYSTSDLALITVDAIGTGGVEVRNFTPLVIIGMIIGMMAVFLSTLFLTGEFSGRKGDGLFF